MNNNETLTTREIETLKLLVLGLENKEIGDRMFISHHTVKSNLEKIYAKLEINNRVQAAVYALKNGIVE